MITGNDFGKDSRVPSWRCSPKWPHGFMVDICVWWDCRQQTPEGLFHKGLMWLWNTNNTSVTKARKRTLFPLHVELSVTSEWWETQGRDGDLPWGQWTGCRSGRDLTALFATYMKHVQGFLKLTEESLRRECGVAHTLQSTHSLLQPGMRDVVTYFVQTNSWIYWS